MQADEVCELRRLLAAATGCVGPCGRTKAIRSSDVAGAKLFVSSSSARVLRSWPIAREHHVVRLVVDKVEAHLRRYHDSGWLFLNFCIRVVFALRGISVSGGLDEVPQFTCAAALHGLALSSDWISDILGDSSCACRQKLEWSDIGAVLALIRSALCKSVAVSTAGEARHLGIVILDAFLGSLSESPADAKLDDSGSLRYSWFCGPDVSWSSAFRGLVLDTPATIATAPRGPNSHIVLFDVSLEQWLPGDTSSGTFGLEKLSLEIQPGVQGARTHRTWEIAEFRKFADGLLAAGVGVLACQKLVEPWLVDYLQQRGVSVLSRLSLRHVDHVRHLSGAIPVTSLSALPNEWAHVWGWVGHIEKRTICEREYTFIHEPSSPCPTGPKGAPVCTLLVGAPDSYALDELKECVPQAVASLREVAHSGTVFFGAGITEVFLADCLAERAKRKLAQCRDEAACRVVLAIADCLWDVAACLQSHKSNVVGRSAFLEAVRRACAETTGSSFRVFEAEGHKKFALLGALDLAGILVRLRDTLDLTTTKFG